MVEVFQNIKYSRRLQKSNSGVVKVVVGFWAMVLYNSKEIQRRLQFKGVQLI